MRYYIIAGEASGDLHGSNLIKSIIAKDAAAVIQCWGGDLMQAAGGNVVKHYRSLAFMGLVEVVMNLTTIVKNINFCKQDITDFQPDVLICIDYPGFNLRIAKWAKQKGLKVIYFIAPQVWAWKEATPNAGAKGLKAARAIGMLTYRNYGIFQEKQTDDDPEKIDNFKASSYIEYQGDKLVKRFNAYSYWLLTKSMDSHHLARKRGGDLIKTLGTIQTPTFIIGINSDILCPLDEQRFMEQHMPNATLVAIDSLYGHDGFIIESIQITKHLSAWLNTHC